MKTKYKSYFVRNHKPGAKYKYIMRSEDFIFELNASRKEAKKTAAFLINQYGIKPVYH